MDELVLDDPKTSLFVAVLKSLEIDGPALFVLDKFNRNVGLAARNVPGIEVVKAANVSVYDLLRHPLVVATKSAMELITARMRPGGAAGKGEADAEEGK